VHHHGRYRLLALANSPFRLGSYFPYYVPILLAVAILCWALAGRIARLCAISREQ
jgi:hypothetical protein